MRFLTVILSIIMLSFSTVTCSDDLSAPAVENISYHMDDAGTHQQEHADFCSPFCACGCCAAPVILSVAYFISGQSNNSAISYFEKPSGLISDIPQAVWQPPQA